ncbi:hypothetical protein Sphch_1947 [Sphingobium chlorophenolicum L-1]|uniref:Uncharacterized protein n=2 Tax=Sphingobium chlorophenolicum TaxID=46429 RepID=F6EUU1_SPHCR|nr:hypothetical protein [Sphingobium chlorophenolicum]AEG49624.1 hypothetical protein Sphch_1947 [Sphingobium chlorophenolicum L-1]KEQ54531.1 hypothetical protein BV95_01064 [Sphingobium chlorophenolicum]
MPAAKPFAEKIFHALLMECFAQQRQPTDDEVDSVASQIWQDSHGSMTGQSWRDVAKGSDAHRQMINAALMAFGSAPSEMHMEPS